MEAIKAPRIMFSAPASGGGKTTVTCGFLQALKNRGVAASAFKCGPDYIDPMFHRKAIGVPSMNLDLFFGPQDHARDLIAKAARSTQISVIEGAMGFYDGIGVSDSASAWDVAQATETPVVLVVDARGRARSIAAEIIGYQRFREDSRIAGVIFNRVSPMLYNRLKELVEEETGIRVFGYLPSNEAYALESRHLGLVLADEIEGLQGKLQAVAEQLEQTVDIDGLIELANSVHPIQDKYSKVTTVDITNVTKLSIVTTTNPVIAVAQDEAFCFYYQSTLDLLESLGAQLVEFSPLHDKDLPENAQGILIGGGYPELYAEQLSHNQSMRQSIANAIEAGMPVVAECGGFMYLGTAIVDKNGLSWPQVSAIDSVSSNSGKLGRFGYITITAQEDNLLCKRGQSLQAHEFHYWDSTFCGTSFHAQKPQSNRGWDCVVATPTLYAGYPHLYLASAPWAAQNFVDACAAFEVNA